MFGIFDKNRDSTINLEEFLAAILGSLSAFRVGLVRQAFAKLDANGNGTLEIDEVKEKFDPSRHPEVKAGNKTVEECRYEFYDMFSTHHNVAQGFKADRSVGLQEFVEYHQFVSSCIDNDNLFKIFMTGVWNLDLVDTGNTVIKPAGLAPSVYGKTAKEQWKYDMHRSLFGEKDQTPMKYDVQSVYQKKPSSKQPVSSGMVAAGTGAWGQLDKGSNIKSQQDVPLYQQYPSQQQQRQFDPRASEKSVLEQVRQKIISRGARGINGIKRVFKIMDDNESKTLDVEEFSKALNEYRIQIERPDVEKVFRLFDRDGNGEINYDEFLRSIVGKMNDQRRNIVTLAFKKFDRDGNGFINIEDLKGRYNASNHPDVKLGKKTEEDILYEFLDTFEQHYSLNVSFYRTFLKPYCIASWVEGQVHKAG